MTCSAVADRSAHIAFSGCGRVAVCQLPHFDAARRVAAGLTLASPRSRSSAACLAILSMMRLCGDAPLLALPTSSGTCVPRSLCLTLPSWRLVRRDPLRRHASASNTSIVLGRRGSAPDGCSRASALHFVSVLVTRVPLSPYPPFCRKHIPRIQHVWQGQARWRVYRY